MTTDRITVTAGPEPAGGSLRTGPLDLACLDTPQVPHWLAWYLALLVTLDALAVLLGGMVGHLARFESLTGQVHEVAYLPALLTTAAVWLLVIHACHGYEARYLGVGSEEFSRVANAASHFTSLMAIAIFMFKWDVARGLVVMALPTATFLTLLFRYLARRTLHHARRRGAASHRVLVVGDGPARDNLTRRLNLASYSGLHVVGVCRPVSTGPGGTICVDHVRTLAESLRADTVAVAHSPQVTPDVLRRLSWSLEGSRMDLLVAPALTDVAGPRVNIRPVSGLPLLQIAEPQFTGARRILKSTIDRTGAAVALLVAVPLVAAAALAIRLTSPGPVLFRQVRIGKDGQQFVMYKLRSMYLDAEARLEQLRACNDHGDGVLFKMRDDPRITRVGRFLRRYSLDELPQLINVLTGQMSLVGPRPPLPAEVARYQRDVHRRLLVKPGLTGLWQVSGRSDLTWEETVRLDLYYVENWSVALDVEILAKTVSAVLRGSGAR